MNSPAPLPITIVTGWYGAGKTAVVETLVAARPGRVAVVHAGPAPVAPDAWACIAVEEELVYCSTDRCPCCSVRLDLLVAVTALAQRRLRPDHVVVELGGDADGAAALQTFLRDPDLRATVEVDGVVTVLDAPSLTHRITAGGSLAVHAGMGDQIALADRMVLARTWHTTERATDQLAWTLHYANPRATTLGSTDPGLADRVLDCRGFTAAGISADDRTTATPQPATDAPTVLRLTADGVLDRGALSTWMDDLHHRQGGDLLRLQGVLAIEDEERRWVARGIRTTLDLDDGPRWSPTEERTSRLWLVGRGLDARELRDGLVSCVSHTS